MRKIFSMIAAILFAGSMMMVNATTIAMPATALDLQNPSVVTDAGWTGEKAYYLDNDVLIASGLESYKSVAKQTWISQASVGSSASTWDELAPFKGSSYYTTASYATLQAGRYLAYLVTNCDSVWAYGYNNAATKYLAMNIYDVTGSEATSIDDAAVEATYAVDNSAAGAKGTGVIKQALNASKTYLVVALGTGGSNSRLFEIAFFRHPGATPEPTTRTIYLNGGGESLWNQANAVFFVHAWGGTEADVKMAQVEGDVYSAVIPSDNTSIVFVRMAPGSEAIDWNTKWNQSADQTIPADKDLFTMTSWDNGTWSKYSAGGGDPEPPTPAEKDSIYFVNVPEWATPTVHLWGGTAAGTEWPGVALTEKETDKINGYDVYKYVADKGAYANCIFSNKGENKTDDLAWTSGKYYYENAWYAKEDIPTPLPDAKPLEGNIWKVVAETPVVAGSHYINEALLKMDGVYGTTLKANTRTIAGEEFTYAIQVRTDGYPTADNKVGKEKAGSTSLVITAKEDVDVTFYYNRQVVGEGGSDNDNKDLIVFDQADMSKVTGVFTIDQILEGNNYLNATKKVALKKDHVYTVTASGTTLQLHGIKLEEHFPAMQIAGAWTEWAAKDMKLAEDKLTATYEVELAKGDYEFKMVKDGAWLTKKNDGQAYGLHREWPGVAGVKDDAAENLKVTADAAGKYTFTWTFANDSIGIAFPEKEPEAKFYITGDSALVVDAGLDKEKAWAPGAIKSMETSYKLNLKAGVPYMLKVTVNGTWEGENNVKGYDALTTVAKGLVRGEGVNNDNICFTLNTAGEVNVHYDGEYFFLNGDFYVAPAKYYLRNNWDGGEAWTWKEMTYDAEDGYYSLGTVVFGGTGVDLNTAESEDGKVWIPAENITAMTPSMEPAQLGALDTVAFVFDPEEVNALTGANGMIAWILGKYVAPATPKFYITGDSALVVDAGLDKEKAWAPGAIQSMETSYKLNLKAGVPYMLKVTVNGTWEDAKGYDALTTVAKGLVRGEGENNDNICFTLNTAGEVNVHYDGEYFFLNGDFYVAPEPEKKYYLKNNWNGGDEWTWKEMTKVDAYYQLENVVFGGNGVNLNTAASEEGQTWIAAADIETFDASYNPATLGALDTVVFFFDPEAVNHFTGANGMSAQIIGKYVAPVVPDLADGYYLIGQKGWDIYALDASLLFTANAGAEGEYVLANVTLEVGQELKVVSVENKEIKTWYGSGEGNYVVTADVAGTKDVYFRPTWTTDWNGHIYIELNAPSGIDNTAVEGKAVKMIQNGQLLIIKNDKTYNVMGQMIR